MSVVLVTGAAGFIGSNLCHYLNNQDIEVIGIDNLSVGSNTKNLGNLFQKPDEFQFYGLDITSEQDMDFLFQIRGKDITHIIHLAAASHVDRSINSDTDFWHTNVCGTACLLRHCLDYPNIQLIINQITDEVYGPSNEIASLEGAPFNPTSPYAASKTAQYYVGLTYYRTFGLPVISTFPTNTYGPRQWPEKLIPKFTLRLLRDQKVPLMESSHYQRDWLAVSDHCRALHLLVQKGRAGESYNIAGDNLISNMEITELLIESVLCGNTWQNTPLLDYNHYIDIVPDRKTHDSSYLINAGKIEYMGFIPQEDFLTYLQQTVEWYRTHQHWYNGLTL